MEQLRNDDHGVVDHLLNKAADEIELLREAGSYMLGWHPTDPEHPAFVDTQKYGHEMMCRLLSVIAPVLEDA